MTQVADTTRPTLGRAVGVIGALLALMWGLEAIDAVTLNSLDAYGIVPRRVSDLPSILWAPFLHFGWAHLISNSLPFLILGTLTYLCGVRTWVVVSALSVLCSGLTAWLLAPPGSITAGASGVIFGYLTYLLARGIFTRQLGQILIALAVFAVYGSVLLGVLPGTPGVSWQGHLGGAAGGVLAAALLHRRRGLRS